MLIVHGFTGRSSEMRFLAESLNARGHTVRVPRLPGHGTNGEDFLHTSARDWVRKTYDEYLDLSHSHGQVTIVGLSMGGVLALLTAAQFNVPRIVLCAPAIHVRQPLFQLAPLVGAVVPKRKRRNFVPKSDQPEERELELQYHAFTWYRPAGRLSYLQRLARRRLSQVYADTLIVVSQSDETVPLSVAPYIEQRISSNEVRTLQLRDSGHVLVNDVDREYVAGEIAGWIKGE